MNRKRISYREFIEQIKVKGNLYMPVIEGKNKMYPLIVTENHGEKSEHPMAECIFQKCRSWICG